MANLFALAQLLDRDTTTTRALVDVYCDERAALFLLSISKILFIRDSHILTLSLILSVLQRRHWRVQAGLQKRLS